ncbi:hypothetical protein H0X09_01485 [Candidatus Saccharibacteria bacterium]|nr:hypothetical protein [Candidatus Saccharibacteria bacterium]
MRKIRSKLDLSKTLMALVALALPAVMFVTAGGASAATPWNLNGSYEIAFTCTSGCSGTYTHDATISSQDSAGSFNIAGGYPAGGSHTFEWSGTGNVSGNAVTTSVNYSLGADSTHMNMAGNVAPSGTMSGTWTDNYPDGIGSRGGTWATTSGTASTTNTKVVTAANTQGWVFNPDPTNATPYNFTENQYSIGDGSLYVQPIGSTAAHKFIAAKTLGTPVSTFESVAYDFLIAGNGTVADADQFYLNVYTKLAGSTNYYDCRYDYVPATGSATNFTTATFNSTDAPSAIADRPDTFSCPATLSGMPAGSTVDFIALNVGDTSASDTGLAGYFDNVVINAADVATTYDFELTNEPSSKDDCKKHGWMNLTDNEGNPFKNQGQCVSYFNHQLHGHPGHDHGHQSN